MSDISDISIAQNTQLQLISDIANESAIPPHAIELYGKFKAKIDISIIDPNYNQNKLVLVTAMSPTSAGEGKTTTTIGLADALRQRKQKTAIALREPSLGPVFGIKGGAAGGGYAQALPMEDLNLHFTGDFHAVGAANNLLAALLDNHIHQGNSLNIDSRSIVWKRCLDMNDRQLRNIVSGLGKSSDGVPRQDGFDITVASEVMAVLCLADSITDLKKRLKRMIVAYTFDKEAITAGDLKAEGAMAVLLKDAIKPNLIQTIEGTPTFVHGGPFANIAHGCNSVLATKMAMSFHKYTVTEAGFGSDLGAEKFFDIKCRMNDLSPDAVVLVGTIRALKKHGGLANSDLKQENLDALKKGLPNLLQHIDLVQKVFNQNVIVALNRFPTDTETEINLVIKSCREKGVKVSLSEVWKKGGEGALDLADQVIDLCQEESNLHYPYDLSDDLKTKIKKIAKKVYKAEDVSFTKIVEKKIREAEEAGYTELPICMAKTQYSFSDDPTLLGAPDNFKITVRDIHISAGAGFIVVLTGAILTMPGLPKKPAAESININKQGKISGLM
ncbi:MAG TPA: formate--tetrahydrofolate ligase [Candidatus Eisenbacteria bacterium]|nr:formate--tetrahydrofolate ligase [Candidatus Eisenbacteria bacterium]